jgi:uncharacterized membrane protein YoaK (UPF0700 family)
MSDDPLHPHAEFAIVLVGGLGLAATAGYINTVVVMLGTLPVTHLTGTVTRLSVDVGSGDRADAFFVAGLAVSFVAGAASSGVIIGASTLRLGRRYGVAVMAEAALIAAAAAVIPTSLTAGAMLAAAAAGLQNAMASSYRNLIIRTTHVTGLLTDLGFMAGQLLTGHRIARWRFALIGSLVAAFLAGGVAGVVAQRSLAGDALWIPAAGLAVGGLGYFAWRIRGSQDRRTGSSA